MSDLDLKIDFKLNTPEAKADAEQVRNAVKGVGFDAQAAAKKAIEGINSQASAYVKIERNIASLKIQLQSFDAIVEKSFDANVIAAYNQKIDETKNQITQLKALGRDSLLPVEQGAGKVKSQFNGLQNSINQISRELPAFTYSAQTGLMGMSNNFPILFDEIGRLRKQNEALVASGQKSVPIWKQLASGLFSWGTALSIVITLTTVFGKEIGQLFTAIFKGKEAFSQAIADFKTLSEVMADANKKAGSEITTLKILYQAATDVTLSTKDRIASAKELQRIFPEGFKNSKTQAILNGEEKKSFDSLTQSIIANSRAKAAKDKLDKIAAERLDIDFQKQKIRNANANENSRAKDVVRDAYALAKGGQEGVSTAEQQREANNKRAQEALREQEIKDKRLAAEEKFLIKFAGNQELAKTITDKSVKHTEQAAKSEANALAQALERRDDLLNKLADLDAEYSRKSFTKDEEELQALKDKFAKARRIVEDFNNDPKNRKVAKVSAAALDPIEQTAIVDLTYRQDTEKLKSSLSEQKELYSKFEDFKLKVGEEAAADRFKKELDTTKTFLEKLKDERAKINDNDATGGQQERAKWLDEQIKTAENAKRENEIKNYTEAYEAAKSHTQKLLDAEIEYRRRVAALGENATAEQIVLLAQQRDAKKQAINAEAIDSETNWAQMFGSFERLSKEAVKKYLDDVQQRVDADFKAGKITVAEHVSRINAINSAYMQFGGSNVFSRVEVSLKKWRTAVSEFGKGSQQAKSAFKDVTNTVSEAAAGAQSILGDVTRTMDKMGASEGTKETMNSVIGLVGGVGDLAKGIATGNPIDIVKGSVAVLTNAMDLFNTKDKKLQKQIDGYQRNLKELGKAYAQLERDINNSVGESYYSDSTKAVENLKKQQGELQKSINAERGKKKADGAKIEEWQRQIDSIPNQIADINKAVSEMLVQTSFKDFSNQLADAFSSAFSEGEDSAKKFDDVFNQVIQNAVKNSLKLKLIEPQVKQFTDSLTAYMQKNNNSVLGFDFEKWKTILRGAGENMTNALQGFESFFKDDLTADTSKDKKTTANAIKGITEETADLVAAQMGGLRLAALEGNNISRAGFADLKQNAAAILGTIKAMFLTQKNIEANTLRTADNTENLTGIKTTLADINRKMDDPNNKLNAGGII